MLGKAKMCQKKKNEHSTAQASLQLIYLLLKRAWIELICLHSHTYTYIIQILDKKLPSIH